MKQPFLTDLPTHLIASDVRRFQAQMQRVADEIAERSLSGYSVLFEDILPGDFLDSIDPTSRQRSFGQVKVFWAWLAQVLDKNASCQKALGLIQSWCQASKLPIPSSDTSSYCKARGRVDIEFLQAIHERICASLASRTRPSDLWQGFTLKAIDGSSVQLMDTAENQAEYPQPSEQKPGCGFPTMGIVGLLNISNGAWEHFHACKFTQHDSKSAVALLPHLGSNDLLLADRAFCTYELIARIRARGAHVLMRLHQAREAALDWRRGEALSPNERLVTWTRPDGRRSTTLTQEEWDELPESITLRIIKVPYRRRDGVLSELIVVTSLTDAATYPAHEVAALYARRWDIELRLRDLKTTLRMERFEVKTPEMARKMLHVCMISINLVRSIMQRAAALDGIPTSCLSFKGVLDLVVASHEGFRIYAGHPRNRHDALAVLIDTCAGKLINQRQGRREPRAVKRRPKNFQMLTTHRSVFVQSGREIPHRNRYRKNA